MTRLPRGGECKPISPTFSPVKSVGRSKDYAGESGAINGRSCCRICPPGLNRSRILKEPNEFISSCWRRCLMTTRQWGSRSRPIAAHSSCKSPNSGLWGTGPIWSAKRRSSFPGGYSRRELLARRDHGHPRRSLGWCHRLFGKQGPPTSARRWSALYYLGGSADQNTHWRTDATMLRQDPHTHTLDKKSQRATNW